MTFNMFVFLVKLFMYRFYWERGVVWVWIGVFWPIPWSLCFFQQNQVQPIYDFENSSEKYKLMPKIESSVNAWNQGWWFRVVSIWLQKFFYLLEMYKYVITLLTNLSSHKLTQYKISCYICKYTSWGFFLYMWVSTVVSGNFHPLYL